MADLSIVSQISSEMTSGSRSLKSKVGSRIQSHPAGMPRGEKKKTLSVLAWQVNLHRIWVAANR